MLCTGTSCNPKECLSCQLFQPFTYHLTFQSHACLSLVARASVLDFTILLVINSHFAVGVRIQTQQFL